MNEQTLMQGINFVLIPKEDYQRILSILDHTDRLIQALNEKENGGWLNTAEACKYLKITPQTLAKWRVKFKMQTSQVGRSCLYSISDINKLLNKKSL